MLKRYGTLIVSYIFAISLFLVPVYLTFANSGKDRTANQPNGFSQVDPQVPYHPLGCHFEEEYHPMKATVGNGMSPANAQKNVTLKKGETDASGNTSWTVTLFPNYGITRGSVTDGTFGPDDFFDLDNARGGFAISKDLQVVGGSVNLQAYHYGYNYYAKSPLNAQGNTQGDPAPALDSTSASPSQSYLLSAGSQSVASELSGNVLKIQSTDGNISDTNRIFFSGGDETTPRAGHLPDPWRKNSGASYLDSSIPPGQYYSGKGLFSQNIATSPTHSAIGVSAQDYGRYHRETFDKAFSLETTGSGGRFPNAKYVLTFKTHAKDGVDPGEFSGVVAAVGSYQNARSMYSGAIEGEENLNLYYDPAHKYDGSEDPAAQKEVRNRIERYRIVLTEKFETAGREQVDARKVRLSKKKIEDDVHDHDLGPVDVNFDAAQVENGTQVKHEIYFKDTASYCHGLAQIRKALRAEVDQVDGFNTQSFFETTAKDSNTVDFKIIRRSKKLPGSNKLHPSLVNPSICDGIKATYYQGYTQHGNGADAHETSGEFFKVDADPNNYGARSDVKQVAPEVFNKETGKFLSTWEVTMNKGPIKIAPEGPAYTSNPFFGLEISRDMTIVGPMVLRLTDKQNNKIGKETVLNNPTAIREDGEWDLLVGNEGKEPGVYEFHSYDAAYNVETGEYSGYDPILGLDKWNTTFYDWRPFNTLQLDYSAGKDGIISPVLWTADLTRKGPNSSWANFHAKENQRVYQDFGTKANFVGKHEDPLIKKNKVNMSYYRDLGHYWWGKLWGKEERLTFKFTVERDPTVWRDGDVHMSYVAGRYKSYDSRYNYQRNDIHYMAFDYGRDTDNDGVADINECIIGSDPKNPDTDKDGRKDGVEAKDINGHQPGLPSDKKIAWKTPKPYYTKTDLLENTDPTVKPIPVNELNLKSKRGQVIKGTTQANRKVDIYYSTTGQVGPDGKVTGTNYGSTPICSTRSDKEGIFKCVLDRDAPAGVQFAKTEVFSDKQFEAGYEASQYQRYKYPEVDEARVSDAQFKPVKESLTLTEIAITDHLTKAEKAKVIENVKNTYPDLEDSNIQVKPDGAVTVTFPDAEKLEYAKHEVVYDNHENYPFLNHVKANSGGATLDQGVLVGNFPLQDTENQISGRSPAIAADKINDLKTAGARPQINYDTDHLKLEFYDAANGDKVKKTIHVTKYNDQWISSDPNYEVKLLAKPAKPADFPEDTNALAGQEFQLIFKGPAKAEVDGTTVKVTAYDISATTGHPCYQSDSENCENKPVILGAANFAEGPNKATTVAPMTLGPLHTLTDAEKYGLKTPYLTQVGDDKALTSAEQSEVARRICLANESNTKYLAHGSLQDCIRNVTVDALGTATATYPDRSTASLGPTQTVYQQLQGTHTAKAKLRPGQSSTEVESEPTFGVIKNVRTPAQPWELNFRIGKSTDVDTALKEDTDKLNNLGEQLSSSDNQTYAEAFKQACPSCSEADLNYGTLLQNVTVSPSSGHLEFTVKPSSEIDFNGAAEKTVYVPVLMESKTNATNVTAPRTKPLYYQSHLYFVPVTVSNPLDLELVKSIQGPLAQGADEKIPMAVLPAGTNSYRVNYTLRNKSSAEVDIYNFDDPSLHGKQVLLNGQKQTIIAASAAATADSVTLADACFKENTAVYKQGLGTNSAQKRLVLAANVQGQPEKTLKCELTVLVNANATLPWRSSDLEYRPKQGGSENVNKYPLEKTSALVNTDYRAMSPASYVAAYAQAYPGGTKFENGKQPEAKLIASAYDVIRLSGDFRLPDTGSTSLVTYLALMLALALVAGAASTWMNKRLGGDS